MNPIYIFELSITGQTRTVYPIYRDDLAKNFERESGQMFFRRKLSGSLTFEGPDYAFIVAQAFDTRFLLTIKISYNGGSTTSTYWRGVFWKTDCEFDADAQTVVVKQTGVLDQYNDVLAGLEKEFDLLQLAPEQVLVFAHKRPLVQVYVPGQSSVGCFLSGMWWEQECEIVTETDTVNVGGVDVNKLKDYLYYSKNKVFTRIGISGSTSPILPNEATNEKSGSNTLTDYFDFTQSGYRYARYQITNFDGIAIYDTSTGNALWVNSNVPKTLVGNYQVTLYPTNGATGNVELDIQTIPVYARYICDVASIMGNQTYELPADDQTDNRNYKRVIGYYDPQTIAFSTALVSSPTKWGIYQPGKYYNEPWSIFGDKFFPIARNVWTKVSIWFTFTLFNQIAEQSGRKEITMKDCFPLSSVISVLLAQIDPGVTHNPSDEYSEFLYGDTPIGMNHTLIVTPKSNVITLDYDQPAQQAKITLKSILDMLRDCFRCYWFIDQDGRFRIEHIDYFRNGGTYYPDETEYGPDLTIIGVPSNRKKWAFGLDKYSFDKPDMAARYQFGWMDAVTEQFEGYPIDIVSKYVEQGKIENIDISNFTSDLDYVMLNPSAISKDGFVLMGGIEGNSGEYAIPFYTYNDGMADYILQNGYLAFCYLTRYYLYDLPAKQYSINGVLGNAIGVKKLKKQSVSYPSLYDPDPLALVRTNLGYGAIAKISVNLSSRNAKATLEYDTE